MPAAPQEADAHGLPLRLVLRRPHVRPLGSKGAASARIVRADSKLLPASAWIEASGSFLSTDTVLGQSPTILLKAHFVCETFVCTVFSPLIPSGHSPHKAHFACEMIECTFLLPLILLSHSPAFLQKAHSVCEVFKCFRIHSNLRSCYRQIAIAEHGKSIRVSLANR